jgi:hypothetical protein
MRLIRPYEEVWDVLRRDLGVRLKAAGFRRKGLQFCRFDEISVACLYVQSRGGDFTIELGVYFPDVVRLLDEHPVAEFPTIVDCLFAHRKRLPRLGPDGYDRWWIVPPRYSELDLPPDFPGADQPRSRDTLSAHVANLWVTCGAPWQERMSDPRNARAALSSDDHLYRAAFSVVAGDLDVARDEVRLEYLAAEARDAPATMRKVREFASRAGIEDVVAPAR